MAPTELPNPHCASLTGKLHWSNMLLQGRSRQGNVSDGTSVPSSQSYRSHDRIRRHWQCPVCRARPGVPSEKKCAEFVVVTSPERRLVPGRQRSKGPICDETSFHIGVCRRKDCRKSSMETEGTVEQRSKSTLSVGQQAPPMGTVTSLLWPGRNFAKFPRWIRP